MRGTETLLLLLGLALGKEARQTDASPPQALIMLGSFLGIYRA